MYTDKSAPEPRATRARVNSARTDCTWCSRAETRPDTNETWNKSRVCHVTSDTPHGPYALCSGQHDPTGQSTLCAMWTPSIEKRCWAVSLQAKVSSPLLHDVPIDAAAPADDDHDTLVLGEEMAVALRPHQSDGRAACRLDEDAVFVEEKGAGLEGLLIAYSARIRRHLLRQPHRRRRALQRAQRGSDGADRLEACRREAVGGRGGEAVGAVGLSGDDARGCLPAMALDAQEDAVEQSAAAHARDDGAGGAPTRAAHCPRTLSSTRDEWPCQRSSCSYGGMYSAAGSDATSSRASSSAAFQFSPCTCTSAPWLAILSSMIFLVVVGTMTLTCMPRRRPMAATACPAFPPDEQMSDVAPRSFSVLHMYAIPRSLNEPLG